MFDTSPSGAAALNSGLLLTRIVLGAGIAAHGAQKLFGWFGGYGIRGTGGFFESLGFRPGAAFALAAGLGEFVGGLLVAVGLFGPVGPALVVTVMVVAMLAVHRGHGFFAGGNGIELPLVYAAGAAVFAFSGYGAYALDAPLGLRGLSRPETAWIALALAVVLGLATNALRRPASPAAAGAPT
jgi:putative oxidoreductase